ncbi:TPA: hypothetical protein GX533_00630 [Candidatus Dojkabacteria bacterium]|uniref:Cell shape-determining protein MreC n=1 Tax=Candidatus Dojkabacteria bacterium TaxID=2099670 RepID=A0A832R8S1_9BACT|nr:hypothetical protein [Candidatus Dojkabacteria bacterium]
MKKQKKAFTLADKNLFLPIAVLVMLLLFFLDGTKLLQPLRTGVSFLFQPISADGSDLGSRINKKFEIIVQISKFQKEFNQMKLDMYEKDVNNSYFVTLQEEKDALQKQLNLANKDGEYLMAKVLGEERIEFLRINKGKSDGVGVGDAVSLGNLFLGVVERVDEYSSKVLLPTAKGSSYEVFITKVGVEQGVVNADEVQIVSKGVIQGVGDYIRIENISSNSNVEDGDVVVISDSKVGDYLVVGKVVGLSSNPAETSKNGRVEMMLDSRYLMSVFVNIKK